MACRIFVAADVSSSGLNSATTLEIAIKSSLGKLTLPSSAEEFVPTVISEMNLTELAVNHAQALKRTHCLCITGIDCSSRNRVLRI